MNILLASTSNNTILGLYQTLSDIPDINVTLWTDKKTSIYTILDYNKPDIFLCENIQLTSSMIEAITEYKLKTVIFGLDNHLTSQENILTCMLSDQISPKILETIKVPYYVMKPATMLKKHTITIPSFDVLYICDGLIHNQMDYFHLLDSQDFITRAIGQVRLPIINYIGDTNTIYRSALCAAAKIVVLNDNTYTHEVFYNHSLALTYCNQPIEPSNLVFNNPQELVQRIIHFLEDNKHYKLTVKKQRKEAIQNTYYHRAADIFTKFNFPEEANKCLQIISKALDS